MLSTTFSQGFCMLALVAASTASNVAQRFTNPVISRLYEGDTYALRELDGDGIRVSVAQVGTALAGLKPTYVSSLIYLGYDAPLTTQMKNDFNSVRKAVLAKSPNCKFDVELSLNPQKSGKKPTYPNGHALREYMESINAQIPIDGWWFDFYDEAQKYQPDWISNATDYAHGNKQTVGGNVFGNVIPPGADAVAFVDNTTTSNSEFGFGFRTKEVAALKHNAGSTAILAHLQSNPQNGPTTESNVYINVWDSTKRANYLQYLFSQQSSLGFTFMLPAFYPIYPGAYAYNPLNDELPGSRNESIYDFVQHLAQKQ